MTTDDLIEGFSLERVSRSPAVFDEQKLRWMNGRYLRELDAADLARRLEPLLGRDDDLEPAVAVAQEKMQTLADFWPLAAFLVEPQRDRPEGVGQGDEARRAPARRWPRPARPWPGPSRSTWRPSRPRCAASSRPAGRQAQAGVPAGARGHQRQHDLAGHLRVRGGAGPRRDAGPRGRRAGAPPGARLTPPLNSFVRAADRGGTPGFGHLTPPGSRHRTHTCQRRLPGRSPPERGPRPPADRRLRGHSRTSPSCRSRATASCAWSASAPTPSATWSPSSSPTSRW